MLVLCWCGCVCECHFVSCCVCHVLCAVRGQKVCHACVYVCVTPGRVAVCVCVRVCVAAVSSSSPAVCLLQLSSRMKTPLPPAQADPSACLSVSLFRHRTDTTTCLQNHSRIDEHHTHSTTQHHPYPPGQTPSAPSAGQSAPAAGKTPTPHPGRLV
jgi:hypothetical protein